MQKVKITISNEALLFSYCDTKPKKDSLLNTNIINNDELMFGSDYLEKNKKILCLFLNDLLIENNIHKIIITEYSLAFIVIDIINKIKNVTTLAFIDEASLPFDLCKKIVENKNLKHINCSSIPPFMLEMLDRNNLLVETRCEVLFTSKFMATNNLSQFSKMYYKTNIRIENEFTKSDFEDFETFCKINRYLKTIHLYIVDEKLLEAIVNILHNLRMKNIKILLHKNINDTKLAEDYKKLNKTYKSKYGISLKIVYSDNYLKENIISQVALNILKTCLIIVFLISSAIFGSILFNNYLSEKKVNEITANINKVIKNSEEKPYEEGQKINNKYMALLGMNSDTVGWLKLNNTNIDYPVVQTTDNDYYLTKGFGKEHDWNGWVFMDYRNTVDELGKNTIIYGHNRFQSGIIFGTLGNVLKKDWYTNEENQIISFDTIYNQHQWQIFSVYSIKKTNDYIQTNFKSDSEWNDFLELIQERSIHNFEVAVKKDDKILTLSTCLETNKRLVVHAILIK